MAKFSSVEEMRLKRPLGVTLLALLVLSNGLLNLERYRQAWLQRQFLEEILPVSLVYIAGSGLVWGLISLPLAWGLWRGSRWAPRMLRWLTPIYCLAAWLDRLVIANRETVSPNDGFALAATLALFVTVFFILSRKPVRNYFGEMNEH